ncbi:MAG TPA: hypothetical protein VF886_16075 [Roseiarcus sp.]|jgi:hypothetical protein
MQTELKQRSAEPRGRAVSEATDENSELALLAEFMRADSVASLAGDIAKRLGADARDDDLIAAAGLGGNRRDRQIRGRDGGLTDAQDFEFSVEASEFI